VDDGAQGQGSTNENVQDQVQAPVKQEDGSQAQPEANVELEGVNSSRLFCPGVSRIDRDKSKGYCPYGLRKRVHVYAKVGGGTVEDLAVIWHCNDKFEGWTDELIRDHEIIMKALALRLGQPTITIRKAAHQKRYAESVSGVPLYDDGTGTDGGPNLICARAATAGGTLHGVRATEATGPAALPSGISP